LDDDVFVVVDFSINSSMVVTLFAPDFLLSPSSFSFFFFFFFSCGKSYLSIRTPFVIDDI
jgi:hypothetical protein